MPDELIIYFTSSGLAFMFASWAVITALVVFCFRRLLKSGPKYDEHAYEEGETRLSGREIHEEPND